MAAAPCGPRLHRLWWDAPVASAAGGVLVFARPPGPYPAPRSWPVMRQWRPKSWHGDRAPPITAFRQVPRPPIPPARRMRRILPVGWPLDCSMGLGSAGMRSMPTPPARLRLQPAPPPGPHVRETSSRGLPIEGFPGQREARPPGTVCQGSLPGLSLPMNPTGSCRQADPPRRGPDRRRMETLLPRFRRFPGPATTCRRCRPLGGNPGQRGAESPHP